MMRYFLSFILAAVLSFGLATPACADLKYFPDPPYQKLNADDPPAMDEMLQLAKEGDVRAQFIIADMYEKGKGGLEQNLAEARHWFETSALHGYNYSFVRLAAIAKHQGKPAEAWQWYTLAINEMDFGDTRKYVLNARHDLVETAKLTQDDMDKARKSMDEWKEARSKQLALEKDVSFEKERVMKEQKERAEKEKLAATTASKDKQPAEQEKKNEQN